MSISYTIRKWAAANARLAQGIIVLAAILLFFLGHLLGVLAEMLGVNPFAMFLIGAGMAILAWTLAPRRGEAFPIRYTYARQKVAAIIMLMSLCIGVGGSAICLELFTEHAERLATNKPSFHQTEAAMGPKFFAETKLTKHFEKGFSMWFQGGISKRVSRSLRKTLKKNTPGKNNTAGKIIGTIAILLFSGLLAILVAMLSCSLSCSGNITLSYIVLIGGLTLVILLASKLLGSIYRKKRTEPLPDY